MNFDKDESTMELFYDDFTKRIDLNREISKSSFGKILDSIILIYNDKQELFRYHFWMVSYGFSNASDKTLLTAAYVKNMHSIIAATELTKIGFYGSARILLRQVFEFLIIGKYSAISCDHKFIKHWLEGGQVNITKQIIRKIRSPKTTEFEAFYSILCNYTHATPFSQQIGIKIDNHKQETYDVLVFILILLECNYHLLNAHFIDSRMRYFGSAYHKDNILKLRKNIKNHFKLMRSNFYEKNALLLISDYKRKWVI